MTSPGPYLYRLASHIASDEAAFYSGEARISLHAKAETNDIDPYLDLCEKVTSYFDFKLDIFRVNQYHYENIKDFTVHMPNCPDRSTSDVTVTKGNFPAFSVMVFVKSSDPEAKSEARTSKREAKARALKDILEEFPWKLHHKERMKTSQGIVNPVSTCQHEFFYTSSHLPLWGLRHVHYGREHVRFVLYTSHNLWSDQVQFYTILLGIDPELLRDDFCLYTVQSDNGSDFDVQFSLKRLPESKTLCILDQFHLQVKVKDIGQLVPLFPNICRPLTDSIWATTDHDGNHVFLDVVRTRPGSRTSNAYQNIGNDETPNTTIKHKHQDGKSLEANDQSVSETCVQSNQFHDDENVDRSPDLAAKRENRKEFPSKVVAEKIEFCGDKANSRYENIELCGIQPNLFLFPPGSQTRGNTIIDEDEESLTLTNTSEESGIQVFHDEVTCYENEGIGEIRPCLSKGGSKFRSTNRRVRFSDEIEAFEDDSLSRLSSGFESDDQSDVEIAETRFPAQIPGTPCSNIDSSSFITEVPFEREEQSGVKRSLDDSQTFRKESIDGPSGNDLSSSASIQKAFRQTHSSPFQSNGSIVDGFHSIPIEEVTFKRKPPSYEVATKRLAELASKGMAHSCPPQPRSASPHVSVSSSKHGFFTSSTSVSPHQGQMKNPQRSPTPLHSLGEVNHNSNQGNTSRSRDSSANITDHALHRRHSSSDRNSNRADSPYLSMTQSLTHKLPEEDNDLNFNLQFDTCPSASGKPRKQQIGFLV